ncbi:MAG: hypothetical protein AVDCRST_MAG93-5356, partial [uncultured Chloroflexia bacterium]
VSASFVTSTIHFTSTQSVPHLCPRTPSVRRSQHQGDVGTV